MVFRKFLEGNSRVGYSGTQESPAQRTGPPLESYDPELSIHPLASRKGILVTVQPPRCPPPSDLAHVPCDIVLVIDVSWSMRTAAPVVGLDEAGSITKEHAGYSVLDITKHAALTVLETLDERDRLGIVTFSTTAKVVQTLQPMNAQNKVITGKQIRALKEENSTNLWQGIVQGIKLFEQNNSSGSLGRVPAVLLLTDGQPNHQHPIRGYVASIQSMSPLPATIHTFGFGNDIKSGLLKSIAEVGGGTYSFIPDAGMVGTVFVNSVAHLQSTFADRCTLTLTFPEELRLRKTIGKPEKYQEKGLLHVSDLAYALNAEDCPSKNLTIHLGNLHFGQSRDIYLSSDASSWSTQGLKKLKVTAELRFSRMYDTQFVIGEQQDVLCATSLPDCAIAYHQSKGLICEYLASFFPVQADGEYQMPPASFYSTARDKFNELADTIPAKDYADMYNKSLMQDLFGQIKLAVFSDDYLRTWAPHYFLSLWDAHAQQMRNTFKDPGVQMYDMDSPLFLECQKKLTIAFDTAVSPPEPSLRAYADKKYSSGKAAVSMSSYNSSDYPCFAASSVVVLADGRRMPVSRLRKGLAVRTPVGSREVVAILKTRVRKITMCKIGNLLVTAWHPVVKGGVWTFPARVAKKAVRYTGAIYSVLLQPDPSPKAHAIDVGGVWAVTLGHGVLDDEDARAHEFLGNYAKVALALSLVGIRSDGVAVASGVRRERCSGRLSGFNGSLHSIST